MSIFSKILDKLFFVVYFINKGRGVQFPIRGDIKDKKFKKILVIMPDNLGHSLLLTPMLKGLKLKNPDSEIHALISPGSRKLISSDHNVDKYIIYDAPWLSNSMFGTLSLLFNASRFKEIKSIIRAIRKQNYGLAIDAIGDFRSSFFFGYLSKIMYMIGYKKEEGSYWLSDSVEVELDLNEIEKSRKLLSLISINDIEKKVDINADAGAVKRVNLFLSNNGLNQSKLVLIDAGSVYKLKRWPIDNYIKIIKWLLHAYPNTAAIFVGTEPAPEISDKIKEVSKNEKMIFDMINKFNVIELFALMKSADLIMANDGSIAYMSSAISVPSIILFGPTQMSRYKPFGEHIFAVSKSKEFKCSPCKLNFCRVNFSFSESACMEEIDEVYMRTLIQQILKI